MPILAILTRRLTTAALMTLLAIAVIVQSLDLPTATAAQISEPVVGGGIPQVGSNAPQSALSNLKAGSLLFFPTYTSSSSSPSQVNTIITLTNTNPRDAVTVRLAWVHDCEVDNTFITLAGNQTQTLLASLENPDRSGYIIALAVNPNGIPTQFNWLIGSASLRNEQGYTATYNAVGVAKRSGGAVATSSAVAPLVFNNVQYDRLPEQVALDHLQNQDPAKSLVPGDTVKTGVSLISPLSDLTGGVAEPIKLTAILYDKSGRPYPQATNGSCSINRTATELWTDPGLSDIISPERPGWARFAAETGSRALPLLGLSQSTEAQPGIINIRHMQAMRYLDTFTIAVPVIKPPSAAPELVTTGQPPAEGKSLGAGEMKPGSILVFPRFASGSQGSSRIFLTNTHPTAKARVRIFFNGTVGNGEVAETIISLFPNETTSLDPKDILPNQRGWILALAIDLRALPLNFNNLIGSGVVTEQTGAKNGYAALAIARNATGSVPRNSDVETSDVIFNDVEYDRLPATLAYNGIPSQSDNITTVGAVRFSSDLTAIPNLRSLIQLMLTDAALRQFSGVLTTLESRMSALNIPSSTPQTPITQTLEAGHRGWLRMLPSSPVLSWAGNVATAPLKVPGIYADFTGGLSGSSTPHILTTFSTFSTRTVALNPNNTGPTADFETIEPVIEVRSNLGTIVRLDGRVSTDPDPEDPLTYRWFDNDVQISTAQVSDYRLKKGLHTIKLIVADGNGTTSEPKIQQVNVIDTTPPVLSGVPAAISKSVSGSVGASINFNLPVAYDSFDGWVSVTATPRPNSLFKVGKNVVTFTAKDSSGNTATAALTITITSGGNFPVNGGTTGNKSPYLNNINDQYLVVGKIRTYVLQAEDPNNETVTFELAGAPAFARIERANPVLRRASLVMAPVEGSQLHASNVRVIARDARGMTYSTLPFRIMLSDLENDETGSGVGPGTGGGGDEGGGGGGGEPPPANQPPTAAMAALPSSVKATTRNGAILKLDGSASNDPEKDPLTYVWKNGDKVIAEGAIVDVPLAVGTHSITLTVTDTVGGTSTTPAQTVTVLPRDLSVTGITPARIPLFNSVNMTITGTGFNSGTTAQFECTSVCTGGSRITLTIISIEEDTIVINAKTTSATPTGNRNLIVTNPGGAVVRINRSNFVSN